MHGPIIIGGGVRHPPLGMPADGIPQSRWNAAPLSDWWPLHSTSSILTSTGAVHKSVTLSGVFSLVQLNMCVVVCGSVLQRRHSGDGSHGLTHLLLISEVHARYGV